jgi:Domain of unknown function (DUF4287)
MSKTTPKPKKISPIRTSDESVRTNTGRSWDQWFKLLDKWGAKTNKHPEIVRFLMDEHDVPGWWAQSVTVAYEQNRGMRAPGQRADGTYSATASKTVNVPVKKLFEAVKDKELREQWLGDFEFDIRATRPGKSITVPWEDGSTRLTFWFEAKGSKKSQVSLAHEKVAGPRQADDLKVFWRERMDLLKKFLEG